MSNVQCLQPESPAMSIASDRDQPLLAVSGSLDLQAGRMAHDM